MSLQSRVFNRGTPPAAFIQEMVTWAKTAPNEIFDRTPTVGNRDIFNKVFEQLGPYGNLIHRKAVMLEVMRCLAGFESSWRHREGVDTSRGSTTTPENAEAGAWQASYDARRLDPSLARFLESKGITNGLEFQRRMKADRDLSEQEVKDGVKPTHEIAMEFVARLLRVNTGHNGPLYKGTERERTWPRRPELWAAEQSIYPWLNRDAVAEFVALLS